MIRWNKNLCNLLLLLLTFGIQANAWQKPVARINNPKFPMTVQVVNQTEFKLDCDLTDLSPDTMPRQLPANEKLSLVLENSEVNISVSYTQQNLQTPPHFKFEFTPNSSNSLTVFVKTTQEPDKLGDDIGEVFDIQNTGAIFVY
ncbi:MAG: hypothetical protein VKK42_12340 [Lyngbya sp.]|nr:hypothetical protein [Lyngbya sp.]